VRCGSGSTAHPHQSVMLQERVTKLWPVVGCSVRVTKTVACIWLFGESVRPTNRALCVAGWSRRARVQ